MTLTPLVEDRELAASRDVAGPADALGGALDVEEAELVAPQALSVVELGELHDLIAAERAGLFAYVAKGLGRGGTNVLRSKEVRHFRKEMKERARDQARSDVDTAMDSDDRPPLLATERAWYAIAAKRKTYGAVKDSVDTAIEKEARKIVDDSLIGRDEAALVQLVLERAGADRSRERLTEVVNTLFDGARMMAKAKKDIRVGKTEANNADLRDQVHDEEVERIGDAVAAQVTEDGVGSRVLDEVIDADSVDEGMGKFGKLLDRVLPSAGDQIAVSVEFRIPIPETPAYVQFTLSGAAARGIDGAMTAGIPDLGAPRRLEVMGKLEFRAGAALLGLDVGGGVNVFMRAGADSTATALKALSYGAYRRLSSISDKAGNFWALGPGSLDEVKNRKGLEESRTWQSEAWAAMLEEQAFEVGEGYSHVGGGVGGSLTAKAPGNLAEVGVQAGVSVFNKYDKETLRDSMGGEDGLFAKPVTSEADAASRRDMAKGATGSSYSYSVSYGVKIAGQSVTFAASVSGPLNFSSFGLEITASLGMAGGSGVSALEERLVGLVPGLLRGLQSLKDGVKNDDKAQAGGAAASFGQVIDSISEQSITNGLGKLYSVSASDSAFATQAEKEAAGGLTEGIATSSSLTVAFLIGYDDGVTARFEIRSGRKLEISADVANLGFKVSIESISRLAAIGYENGQWSAEFLGERAGNVPDDVETRRRSRAREQARERQQ